MRRTIPWVLAVAASMLALHGNAQSRQPEPFHGDLDDLAAEHEDFRRVLYTGQVQLAMMTLRPGENIGEEAHDVDQCFFVLDGRGEARLDGQSTRLDDDEVLCVPAGTRHDLRNADENEPLRLVTVYGSPQHAPDAVHHTRDEARQAEQRQE